MRKLVVFSFISLDGVMQAPGEPDEDPSGGFKLGAGLAPTLMTASAIMATKQLEQTLCHAARKEDLRDLRVLLAPMRERKESLYRSFQQREEVRRFEDASEA